MTNEILPAEAVDKINRPTAQAVCLPNEAYTSAEFLDAERRLVFAAGWAFVGVAADLKKPGDVVPVALAGMPLLLVRGHDGSIRAFHNVCRHRGAQLISERRSAAAVLTCRYHGWTYALDGALVRTPHFSGPNKHDTPAIDRACMGLSAVRCETWNDLVFVNVSGTAPPLAVHLAPLNERWAPYDLTRLRHGASCTFEVAANWKLAVENFLESYHLPFAHPTLNAASKMHVHYSMLEELFIGQGSRGYDSKKAGHGDLPRFPCLSAQQAKIAEYPTMLPNLMLGLHPDYLFVFGVDPLSAERTRETFHFYFVGEEALAPALQSARNTAVELWHRTNVEDIVVVEAMQIGRHSPGYVEARFSPYHEQTTHEFQRRIANLVAAQGGTVRRRSRQVA